MPQGARPTPRDLQLLHWLGEMYAAPMSLVGELLARWSATDARPSFRGPLARRAARRLEALGYAGRHWVATREAGERWLVPTQAGLRYAGLDFEEWSLVGWKADHVATVGRLRLVLEDRYEGAVWESERSIRRRYRQQHLRGRIPDGLLEFQSGSFAAIEVELSRKTRARYPELLEALESWDVTWWFVRTDADAQWLRERMGEARLPLRPVHEVEVLPQEILP
jgi:hypothetical protein